MDGKTLEDYLCSWVLAMYVEKFKEQKIKDINMLQLLSQEDIKELIPILGHRVKLIAGIKQLKQIIDKAFPTEEQEQNVLNIGDVISTSTNDISLSSILNTHEYCILLSDVPAKEPHTSVRLLTYTTCRKRRGCGFGGRHPIESAAACDRVRERPWCSTKNIGGGEGERPPAEAAEAPTGGRATNALS
ncbi:hypothetical protein EVAR_46489_1 [Eumeta japonica]|uniref:SAM domain-containing protein n=1 Tax=Eumeta variegata TaxID=151549 RepID=A0A4C1WVN4_EUMVA|nr:hypothetical protein EVAR_46489_1 [Eumeta japonica]